MKKILFFLLFFSLWLCSLPVKAISKFPVTLPERIAKKNGDVTTMKKSTSPSMMNSLLSHVPLLFTENMGQMTDAEGKPMPNLLYKVQAKGLDLYITEKGLTYFFLDLKMEEEEEMGKDGFYEEKREMEWERVEMNLQGAAISRGNIIAEFPGQGSQNFFMPHCPDGIYGVKDYGKITIKEIYPGIDWVLYNSSNAGFKYDFIVHPGADASSIKLKYLTARKPVVDGLGRFVITCEKGQLIENLPYSYVQSTLKEISSNFVLTAQQKIGKHFETELSFGLQQYDKNEVLVIDPPLTWATYYGAGSFEGTYCMDTDKFGNVFLGGYTASFTFPVLNAGTYFQGTLSGGGNMAFIIKFSATGQRMWATYYGSNQSSSQIYALTCDNTGVLYCTGQTSAANFPVQNSGGYFQGTWIGDSEAFILKFDNLGARLWATYYGGTGAEGATSIDTDAAGNVYVCGVTLSTNFPVLNGGGFFQGTMAGTKAGFLLKFNTTDTRLWSTYYNDLAPDALTTDLNGNIFVTGTGSALMTTMNPGGGAYFQAAVTGTNDAAVLKFNSTTTLLWSTFYGGNDIDMGKSIRTDNNSNVFMMGVTSSSNLPVQNAGTYFQPVPGTTGSITDVFITKFSGNGNRLWATYFGGSKTDAMSSNDNLEIDSCGNVMMSFETNSWDLPRLQDCMSGYLDTIVDTTGPVLKSDIFLARFNNNGKQLWGTYFGGNGYDFRSPIALDRKGALYLSGEWVDGTVTATYPLTNPGGGAYIDTTANGGDDVYLARFLTSPSQNYSYPAMCLSDTAQNPLLSPGFITGGFFSSAPGLSINPITGIVYPQNSTPGTYTVQYGQPPGNAACLCTQAPGSSSVAILTISPGPTITINGPLSCCIGQSVILTAGGALTYTWSTGTIGPIFAPTMTTSTIFTVTGTDNAGCKTKKSVPISAIVCPGLNENSISLSGTRVYPNPGKGDLKIESEKDMDLFLYSETGQLIKEIGLHASGNFEVQVRGLAPGVYFLQDKRSGAVGQKIVVVD